MPPNLIKVYLKCEILDQRLALSTYLALTEVEEVTLSMPKPLYLHHNALNGHHKLEDHRVILENIITVDPEHLFIINKAQCHIFFQAWSEFVKGTRLPRVSIHVHGEL